MEMLRRYGKLENLYFQCTIAEKTRKTFNLCMKRRNLPDWLDLTRKALRG